MKYLLVLLLAFSIFPQSTAALTTSPVRLELAGNPGETVSAEFKLYNESRQARIYKIHFANFTSKNETGQPELTNDPGGLASWVQVPVQTIELSALERKSVQFTAAIPQNADPGGYFAAAMASTISETPAGEGNVAVDAEVGTLVLLRVNGAFQEGADILEFATKSKRNIYRSLPVDFYYRFQNGGTSWVKPLGDIVIENTFGGTTKIVPANPDGGNVLPRSIRRYEASWLTRIGEVQDHKAERPGNLPQGFWSRVKHETQHFALGRYTANITLTYGDLEQKQAKAKTAFWVLPWELIITALAGLAAITGLITLIAVFIAYKILKRRK